MSVSSLICRFFAVLFLNAFTMSQTCRGESATVWLIGDSTVHNGNKPQVGWGEVLAPYFDPAKASVNNKAMAGRSSRTFLNEGRWKEVAAQIKPGDVLLIQFGHNDVGPIDAAGKFRGSLKSNGDEVESVTKPDGTTEQVHSFGWYIRQFAAEAKAKGAQVVILSPVPHKEWNGDKLKDDFASYRKWDREVAKGTGAYFVDLTAIVTRGYNEQGSATVETFFADPRTHTSQAGAEYNARSVVAGLRGLPGDPLASLFSPKAAKVTPAPQSN